MSAAATSLRMLARSALLLACAFSIPNAFHVQFEGEEPAAAPPTLHMLFMIGDDLPFSHVWTAFFAGASRAKFRVWVHCSVGREACMQRANLSVLPDVEVVATVPSARCVDLVSPEVRLLEAALAWRPERPEAAQDKFVLLSDSTLPVKPFATIYSSVVSIDQSQFCFAREERWLRGRVNGSMLALPMADQWVVFNRPHAISLTENWEYVNATDKFQWRFPMNGQMVDPKSIAEPSWRTGLCTDEVAVFANIHGAINLSEGDPDYSKYDTINSCTTFATFFADSHRHSDGRDVRSTIKDDSDTHVSLGNGSLYSRVISGHPYTFHAMGSKTMHALRASEYLFARKFAYDADLDGYAEIMFS